MNYNYYFMLKSHYTYCKHTYINEQQQKNEEENRKKKNKMIFIDKFSLVEKKIKKNFST